MTNSACGATSWGHICVGSQMRNLIARMGFLGAQPSGDIGSPSRHRSAKASTKFWAIKGSVVRQSPSVRVASVKPNSGRRSRGAVLHGTCGPETTIIAGRTLVRMARIKMHGRRPAEDEWRELHRRTWRAAKTSSRPLGAPPPSPTW